ncbi:MAG: hypothetical protein AAF236_09840 [Verrucomicrobiota bacterium]
MLHGKVIGRAGKVKLRIEEMAYWHMTKKVVRHPAIGDDETVLHACYGLSANFVALSNVAALGTAAVSRQSPHAGARSEIWQSDFDGKSGMAEPIQQTGVFALTDQRLIYFKKNIVVGRPKKILATWPLDQISGVGYAEKILLIRFVDGSFGGLHVPGSQHPLKFVEAFDEVSRSTSDHPDTDSKADH